MRRHIALNHRANVICRSDRATSQHIYESRKSHVMPHVFFWVDGYLPTHIPLKHGIGPHSLCATAMCACRDNCACIEHNNTSLMGSKLFNTFSWRWHSFAEALDSWSKIVWLRRPLEETYSPENIYVYIYIVFGAKRDSSRTQLFFVFFFKCLFSLLELWTMTLGENEYFL